MESNPIGYSGTPGSNLKRAVPGKSWVVSYIGQACAPGVGVGVVGSGGRGPGKGLESQ